MVWEKYDLVHTLDFFYSMVQSREQFCFKIKSKERVLNIVLAIDKPISDKYIYLSLLNTLRQLLLVRF